MIMIEESNNKNSGFSLVELIVAVSVATIVSAAIGGLMFYAIRIYSNQNILTSIQKEIQMTLNQIVDSTESAGWFYLDNTYEDDKPTKTNCVALGKIIKDDSSSKWYFVGEIYISGDKKADTATPDRFDIYMNRYAIGGMELTGDTKADRISSAVNSIISEKNSILSASDKKKYLIGEDATKFIASIDKGSVNTTAKTYTNPLSLDISIEYARTGFGRTELKREVQDQAMFRNYLSYDIVIGSDTYKLKE